MYHSTFPDNFRLPFAFFLPQAPVRSGKDPDQHMGLGSLFPSVACNTLFLPATSLTQLNNLHGENSHLSQPPLAVRLGRMRVYLPPENDAD